MEVMKPRKLASSLPTLEKIDNLTQADCVTLARGFDYLSKTSGNNDDAIGNFLKRFPVMKYMSERNPILEDLLVFTSVRLANDGKKYAAVRLLGCALLSLFDTVTDVYMIYTYWTTDQVGFAYASLASLLLNIVGQMVIVFFQNSHQSKRKMLREIMYVLSFTKPGVDAYRVVIGAEQGVGAMYDPKSELVSSKIIEMFTVAVPGAIIQSYAFLTGSSQSSAAIFSLVVSIFTASFTSTGLSFDLDLDLTRRSTNPTFYGYIPDGSKEKMKTFAFMSFVSACQLIAKTLCCALCVVESSTAVFAYLGIDMALYLAYKLLRWDFYYWLPIYGLPGAFFAFWSRVIVKIVVDFTACVHFRHAYELGGSYFTFTFLTMPVDCFYFGSRYLEHVESDAGKSRQLPMVLNAPQVYGFIGGVMALQVMTFVLFLRTINPEYIRTFYSSRSGNAQAMAAFYENNEDTHKLENFNRNRHKWKKIKEEVLTWVNSKILEWNESQPEWWDARRKAAIYD
ncbi:hypothetical protein TL16_g08626 [Triparma laevis f. inornata]|uniref:Uncharacterized protein n=1 Tax=Triparma laevis f. inornata TaxID=1714386 RepID=A0A9W7AYW7_9STRA|nr:hypothetical protein TL16_g08626 [Triparma laevis f. inornata]